MMIESLFSSTNYQASKKLLDAAALRHEGIAANLANVETPGYKRVDLSKSFSAEFAARLRSGNPASAPAPKLIQDASATSERKDGNNVEIDKELLLLGKNVAEYDVLTEFVSGSIKQLRMAISGRIS
jgi:flagellar basal-body rod protein FlgB